MLEVPNPAWMAELSPEDHHIARCRLLLKVAALYATPGGKLRTLGEELGLATTSIGNYTNISPELAIKLENILGRELFPRELFRPDLFLIKE